MAATIFYDDTNSTVKLFDLKNDHETLKLTVAHIEAGDGNYSPASPASISTPTVSLNPSTYDHPSNPHRQLCHGECVLSDWHKFVDILNQSQEICLDGTALDIPSVVAVASYGARAAIIKSPNVTDPIDRSVIFLDDELKQSRSIYGINTGFGGSADTRTGSLGGLQVALLQMQLSGILPVHDVDQPSNETIYEKAMVNDSGLATLAMPEPWVRGAMLVRSNSLVRGHSAVRLSIIDSIVTLLRNNMVPLVPLRGSISASGDLCPLSYIAGTLEGNPDVLVLTGDRRSRRLLPADKALSQLGMSPVKYGPKEGLGVLNGTAFSTTVGALALNEADHLAVLSQILTAMGVEALSGTVGSFDPFIAAIRPHQGQVEVAGNISSFLKGSKLAREDDECDDGQLRQDRYALRTSSQWVGPYLEDLVLARQQLEVELNSTTDNPLFDVSARKVHHGGNFQAVAVTSSTEKTRLALQMMGKMIFAQSTELLDVHVNNGLPPNLSMDEPSLSFTLKGVDINMAAYMSELAFLANPVSSHVQSAEMGNQSLNSMALVSARYTHMALDLLSLMSSAYLYSLCQALDLRVMQALFVKQLEPAIEEITTTIFGAVLLPSQMNALHESLWETIAHTMSKTVIKDSSDRFIHVAKSAQPILLDAFENLEEHNTRHGIASSWGIEKPLALLRLWTDQVALTSRKVFVTNRDNYLAHGDATAYLGSASKRMYKFVREDLEVPFHRGLCDHPTFEAKDTCRTFQSCDPKSMTTGSRISIIHKALRNGKLMVPVMECLKEALQIE